MMFFGSRLHLPLQVHARNFVYCSGRTLRGHSSKNLHVCSTRTTFANHVHSRITAPRTSGTIYYASRPLTLQTLRRAPEILLRRTFHTSPPRHVPQFLAFLFAPVSRLLIAVGGRLTRSWWTRLSPKRRLAIKNAIIRRRKVFYGIFTFMGAGFAVFYLTHLEETPLTGRKRFVIFSRKEVLSIVESEKKSIFELIFEDEKNILRRSHPTYAHVRSIVSNILASNTSPEFEGFDWKLYVVDKPGIVNAMVLPTGDIFVFTGLVRQCKSEDELAFILSHEISHAILGHGTETLSHNGVLNILLLILIAVIWSIIPSDFVSYFMHSFSKSTVQLLLEYPHSRKLEMEADKVSQG